MIKKFKYKLEKILEKSVVTMLITICAMVSPIKGINISTELPKKYSAEEIKEISRALEEEFLPKEIKPLTYKERKKYLDYAFNEIKNLPEYI